MQERPLVLVIEDVHWLDNESWLLLISVLRTLVASSQPFWLLLTMRPQNQTAIFWHHIEAIKLFSFTNQSLAFTAKTFIANHHALNDNLNTQKKQDFFWI